MIFLENLNMVDKIIRKCPFWSSNPSCCMLCLNAEEDLQNVFSHCSYSRNVWEWLLQGFGCLWVFDCKVEIYLFQLLCNQSFKEEGKNSMYIIYGQVNFVEVFSWKRIQHLFEDSVDECDIIKLNVTSWCAMSKVFHNYSSFSINS